MITFTNITKQYGDHIVFNNYSNTFQDNKVHVLLGESGAGKTTLVRLLTNLEQPDKGSIQGTEKKQIAMVFQDNRLLENLSVSKNIRLAMKQPKTQQQLVLINDELTAIGLPDIMDKEVSTLSGGMKRRVAILRALLAPSDILIFDEALQGLDEENEQKTMDAILRHTQNKTVFWITHNKKDLQYFTDPIVHTITSAS